MKLDNQKSVIALLKPDKQMFFQKKSALFHFLSGRLFDLEGLGDEARQSEKRNRLVKARQAINEKLAAVSGR